MTKISIVSPCYNEEANIEACYDAVRSVFEKELPDYEYEHIFADNASSDQSREILHRLAKQDLRVKVIVNARNYGPFRSTFNALRATSGQAVLVMLPVDLQDPPELLPTFVEEWEKGAKIVYGQRIERDEGIIMQKTRQLYYRMVSLLADVDIPMNTAEFQLLDRQVVDALMRYNDHYPYIRGMIANCGFVHDRKVVPYRWRQRRGGISKNRMMHLVDQGLNGLISFTGVPLRLATLIGFGLSIFSMLYAFVQLAINLLNSGSVVAPGIPTLIVAIFFFSGVQLFFIGLLGEYIGSIHAQVRRGAIVVERERINFSDESVNSPS